MLWATSSPRNVQLVVGEATATWIYEPSSHAVAAMLLVLHGCRLARLHTFSTSLVVRGDLCLLSAGVRLLTSFMTHVVDEHDDRDYLPTRSYMRSSASPSPPSCAPLSLSGHSNHAHSRFLPQGFESDTPRCLMDALYFLPSLVYPTAYLLLSAHTGQ